MGVLTDILWRKDVDARAQAECAGR